MEELVEDVEDDVVVDFDFFFDLATVVVVVLDDEVGGLGAPAATPEGSSSRKVFTACRATAGGSGTGVPFGRKAIVMSSPFLNLMESAFEGATAVPFVVYGDGHVSTAISPGSDPHFVTLFL